MNIFNGLTKNDYAEMAMANIIINIKMIMCIMVFFLIFIKVWAKVLCLETSCHTILNDLNNLIFQSILIFFFFTSTYYDLRLFLL